MGISAHVGHFEGLAGRKKHCRAWAFFRAFSKVVWAGPKNTEFDYILGKKWDMSFLFGHKSGHFRRGRCRKKAKYWAFRAFSSKIVVGRMSGIFRQILGIFRANHLVTLVETPQQPISMRRRRVGGQDPTSRMEDSGILLEC